VGVGRVRRKGRNHNGSSGEIRPTGARAPVILEIGMATGAKRYCKASVVLPPLLHGRRVEVEVFR